MRAFQLVCLVPGLETKLKRLQISILIGLMGDLRSVSHRMVSCAAYHEAWLDQIHEIYILWASCFAAIPHETGGP